MLEERIGALFEDNAWLLCLKSGFLITAQASDSVKAGKMGKRLLRFWREDLKREREKMRQKKCTN
jgi:hypothetical protein